MKCSDCLENDREESYNCFKNNTKYRISHFQYFQYFERGIYPKPVLKNPYLFNKLSEFFRDIKFWGIQTQNSVETLFLSERANTKLFRTSKIFEIDALFVKLEGFLY